MAQALPQIDRGLVEMRQHQRGAAGGALDVLDVLDLVEQAMTMLPESHDDYAKVMQSASRTGL